MKKPDILMLGWEFPPNLTGGLGVACYHIVKALREHANITLILPYVPSRIKLHGVRVIGIGNLNLRKYFTARERKILFHKYHKQIIDFDISPYPARKRGKQSSGVTARNTGKNRMASRAVDNPLAGTCLYGDNVIEKTQCFAEITGRISRKIPFDIIHAHDWMTFPAARTLKETTGKPLVLHIHSLNIDRIGPEHQGWIYNLEKEALENADLILPVSNYTAEMIREHYGIKKKKIHTVYNGVRNIKPFHSPKKFPEKMVLFLGRLTYQKGPEYFLEVASDVINTYKDIRFVIAGDGDKFYRIIEESAYRDIGHRVHFTGRLTHEKVDELLSMTDVFVMPSVSEPFGLVALEAAQFGVPVIISKHSGAAEVLKGALKVDFWDTDLMVSHILRLLSDPGLRKKVINQGYQDLENLTWENAALNITRAYKKLL